MATQSAKILVVDDEAPVLDLITAYLQREGYDVVTASDGIEGLMIARGHRPDVIILDVMLPGLDGLAFLSELRRESNVYVILLTAKSEETDKIVGLSLGADDYVTKPFSPREVVARVKAALRRLTSASDSVDKGVLLFRHLRIDLGSRKVWMDGRPVDLTAIEFDILRTLAENPGYVLSRAQILEKVWGYDYYGEERVVDVHMGHIRQKLGEEQPIATVRGVGYRFEEDLG
jgi:two-component system alkaline phosphatase synthesis response regulator PhoP